MLEGLCKIGWEKRLGADGEKVCGGTNARGLWLEAVVGGAGGRSAWFFYHWEIRMHIPLLRGLALFSDKIISRTPVYS